MDRRYTATAVQVAPAFLDLEGSLAIAVRQIEAAASMGARLVVFPETWLPGYPVWADAGIPWEDDACKRAFARLHRNAVEVPGKATDVLTKAARTNRVHVVIGMTERDARFSNGTLFNSLMFISDDGTILGTHRKLVPTHSERVIWGQGDGSTLHVFDTSVGRLGGLICWEHWMPLARFAMHAKGEQVHAAVWPDVPEMHLVASRSYAFEGRCYVVCAGLFLPLDAVPEDLEIRDAIVDVAKANDDPSLVLIGGSGIVGPDGDWVVEPVAGGETLICADIDLDRIAEEQQSLDTAGHYNRPDVFHVRVDETPRDQVTWKVDEDPRL